MRNRRICHFCRPEIQDFNLNKRCSKCFSPALRLDPEGRCDNCRLIPLVFNKIRYLWDYENNIRDLIYAMKYHPSRKLCSLAGEYLASSLKLLFPYPTWDLVIPLPSSKQSLKRRQFNQCQLIGNKLIQGLEKPVTAFFPYGLKHLGYKHLQASLDKKLRIRNVRNIFKANDKRVKDKSILLFDDVITTGATSTSAAITLLKTGAKNVDLLALARSHAWEEYRLHIYRRMTRDL